MRIGIFGAAPDTGNMGVSALLSSTINALRTNIEGVDFTVFDNRFGKRTSTVRVSTDVQQNVTLQGVRLGRRYYRSENLATMHAASKLGGLGAKLLGSLASMDECDAILDISGGDSFTDLYGESRFKMMVYPKLITINRKIPLILLPQTYGPYNDPAALATASAIAQKADYAWARDENSFGILKGLLEQAFDPKRHVSGIDMAFGLVPADPGSKLPADIAAFIGGAAEDRGVVGLNISGLIYNDPQSAKDRYKFIVDYKRVVMDFIRWVLSETDLKILLVPHVITDRRLPESDENAALDAASQLGPDYTDRVKCLPGDLDQNELKWIIGKMDWFCGTRMHATIASLSSGVPTATISYSDKALGVFASCRQEGQVYDPRRIDENAVFHALKESLLNRDAVRPGLQEAIAGLKQQSAEQARMLAEQVKAAVAGR